VIVLVLMVIDVDGIDVVGVHGQLMVLVVLNC